VENAFIFSFCPLFVSVDLSFTKYNRKNNKMTVVILAQEFSLSNI